MADETKKSALAVVGEDAERIAASLVPSVNKLPQVVGVLVQQVKELAGGELKNLADEALGIQSEPEPTTTTETAAAPAASAADVTALQSQLAEQAATIKALQEQIAADKAAAAQIDGSSDTPQGGGSE